MYRHSAKWIVAIYPFKWALNYFVWLTNEHHCMNKWARLLEQFATVNNLIKFYMNRNLNECHMWQHCQIDTDKWCVFWSWRGHFHRMQETISHVNILLCINAWANVQRLVQRVRSECDERQANEITHNCLIIAVISSYHIVDDSRNYTLSYRSLFKLFVCI